jgi:hypothetical protein
LVDEQKRDFGDGASDPSIQAGLSMIRCWAQRNVCIRRIVAQLLLTHGVPQHRIIRENTCCPTFLLASAGPWITVLGAIFTDKVVVQRLTDFVWVGHDATLNERHCYRVAHILHSLGRSLLKLNDYYLGLRPELIGTQGLHPRYFPSIRAYRDPTGGIVNFTYIRPLERDPTCVTFLARTSEASAKNIVVKFVERYGEAAHRLLEKTDAAPRLFYCGKPGVCEGSPTYGHICMVVMEYLDGMTAEQAQRPHQLPSTLFYDIQDILNHLHENDFVFGDLRSTNIMITKNNKVKFIDFDWAGKAGVSRYPLLLSQQISWAGGVKGLAVMEKQHDLDMLERLV